MSVDAQPVLVGDVDALAHHSLMLPQSDNSGLSVDGEAVGPVVQAAHVVVLDLQVAHQLRRVDVEVVLSAGAEVLGGDSDVVVAVVGGLHVEEAEDVQELVHDGGVAEAALAGVVASQVQSVDAAGLEVPNTGVAAAAPTSQTHVVDIFRLALAELNAGVVFNILDTGFDGSGLQGTELAFPELPDDGVVGPLGVREDVGVAAHREFLQHALDHEVVEDDVSLVLAAVLLCVGEGVAGCSGSELAIFVPGALEEAPELLDLLPGADDGRPGRGHAERASNQH